MTKLRQDGLAEEVLRIIIQVVVVSRRMLSAMTYTALPDGSLDRYVHHPVQMSRAVERLKELGYVEEIVYGGQKYLAATDEGKRYAAEMDFTFNPVACTLSVKNAKELKIIMANAEALCVARSAKIFSLPSEKANFGTLAAGAGAITVFRDIDGDYTLYDLADQLSQGVLYTRLEIREAYKRSSNSAMAKNSSRRSGMIFKSDKVVSVFDMSAKKSVLTVRGEVEFDAIIKNDFEQMYNNLNGYHTAAYITVPTMNYLPSFFHGVIDGVEDRSAKGCAVPQDDNLTQFKIDKLPLYDEVYMMPKGPEWAEYRELLNTYSAAEYDNDLQAFNQKHPGETNVIICRFPELVRLRKAYRNYDHVTLVGPGDEKFVDLLSRCMRDRLLKYYDINTGDEIQFRRYNTRGLPLVGNTKQIDHYAPRKLGGKFMKKG